MFVECNAVGAGVNSGPWQVLLPSTLQPLIKNHLSTPSGHELGWQLEDQILMSPSHGYLWAQLRKYTDQAFPNNWQLYVGSGSVTYGTTNGQFRGCLIFELN